MLTVNADRLLTDLTLPSLIAILFAEKSKAT